MITFESTFRTHIYILYLYCFLVMCCQVKSNVCEAFQSSSTKIQSNAFEQVQRVKIIYINVFNKRFMAVENSVIGVFRGL